MTDLINLIKAAVDWKILKNSNTLIQDIKTEMAAINLSF